jgi:tRNA threonylcarbamoyladenosine biosynthesis protein TsaE
MSVLGKHRTGSEAETRRLAADMVRELRRGDLVALFGELGTGKTQFVKGVCEGFRVRAHVSSPTFVILNRYEGSDPEGKELLIYHLDLYRIGSIDEIFDLGYEEFLNGNGICLVEWGERLAGLLPGRRFDVRLSYGSAEHDRVIEIEAPGQSVAVQADRTPARRAIS